MILTHAKEEQKNVIYYMYNEEQVSISFKSLSKHPIFYDCVFFSLFDPPSSYF